MGHTLFQIINVEQNIINTKSVHDGQNRECIIYSGAEMCVNECTLMADLVPNLL